MALIRCGGADVERGRIHFPQRGPWYAELTLDTAKAPTGKVTIAAAGGFSLAGTVQRAGVFLDSARVRIVGGAGGLGTIIPPSAYQNALLRDALGAVMQASGETLSATIDPSITGVLLPMWTHVAQRATGALDRLTFAAGKALGKTIVWRVLGDGTLWLGAETWPAQSMPAGSDVLAFFPDEGRYEIGAATPALLPGVKLAGVGQVGAVDHWLEHNAVRTWAWLA
jgi:hypothetical protein